MQRLILALLGSLIGSVIIFQVVIKPHIDWKAIKDIFSPKIREIRVGQCIHMVDRDTGKVVERMCPKTREPKAEPEPVYVAPPSVKVEVKPPRQEFVPPRDPRCNPCAPGYSHSPRPGYPCWCGR